MSTNVPINRMTVMPMPPVTIPLVPIDAPAIPGTKETEQAAIFVSLTNTEVRVTSVCYDARISPSLSFCIVIWSLKFWKYIFLTWVGPESRPRSPRCSLLIPCGAAKGNLFDNQQLDNLVIISFIPIILMFGSAVIRRGEVKCQTLLGVKGLRNTSHLAPNLPPPLKKKQFHWSLQFVAYNYVELSILISRITQNFFHSQKKLQKC